MAACSQESYWRLFSDCFATLAIGNHRLPGQPCRRRHPFCWFQIKVTREHVCGPEDGILSEALLISGKDIPGTACVVQKTTSFRCLPLSGKDLPGLRAWSLVWPKLLTWQCMCVIQWCFGHHINFFRHFMMFLDISIDMSRLTHHDFVTTNDVINTFCLISQPWNV